ncbi:CPBP family glutamic-type intramembrane protease [Myxococcus qinghaiensis]|uniref:CPBP family glutamic-type intramembrane protease n=1 Tax=Myxococcus qinghaiensis TaxID=2906758 RepID=UPI003899322A
MGGAALAEAFLFAAGHSRLYSGGAFQFSALAMAVTGLIGFGLLWIRQRTASLLLPILVHNVINVRNGFF